TKLANEPGLILLRRRVQHCRKATAILYSDKKYTSPMGIKRGGFQVKLQTMKVPVGQPAKVDASAEHQVLFNRTHAVIGIGQFVDTVDPPAQTFRGARRQLLLQRPPIAPKEEIAIAALLARQFTIAAQHIARAWSADGQRSLAQVSKVHQRGRQQPGPKALSAAD